MVVKIPKILQDTNQIIILVDNNPIQLVTKIFPQKPIKSVGFNIKMEQDSYVRAAILDEKNIEYFIKKSSSLIFWRLLTASM